MPPMKFSSAERDAIVARIQTFFETELDASIGALPAEQLLGFFSDQIGSFFYNRGVLDARSVLRQKLEDIDDALYGLERREADVR